MKISFNKSVVKAVILSVLVVFSIEFAFQRAMLELIKENSYKEMNKCLIGDLYPHRDILKNKEIFNSKQINEKLYNNLIKEIEAKEEVNTCLINYIYDRNGSAQKNISSYLYAMLTLIIVLTFSSIVSFVRKILRGK